MKVFIGRLRYQRCLFIVVVLCVIGGLLLGGIHFTRATQTEIPDCNKIEEEPICPEPKRSCLLEIVK